MTPAEQTRATFHAYIKSTSELLRQTGWDSDDQGAVRRVLDLMREVHRLGGELLGLTSITKGARNEVRRLQSRKSRG